MSRTSVLKIKHTVYDKIYSSLLEVLLFWRAAALSSSHCAHPCLPRCTGRFTATATSTTATLLAPHYSFWISILTLPSDT